MKGTDVGGASGRKPRSLRTIRRRTLRLVRNELALTGPIEIDDVCARLTKLFDAPVRCIRWPFPTTDEVGMWVETDQAHLVFVEQHLTVEHQRMTFFHEVGHMTFDHPGDPSVESSQAWESIAPQLADQRVRKAVCRSVFDNANEYEAEVFGSFWHGWNAELRALTQGERVGGAPERGFDEPRGWQ